MISFYTEKIEFKLFDKKVVENWIKKAILFYEKKVGDINVIFCNDEYLLEINRQFLKHDYYTDVITFDENIGNKINGEIYISIDRAFENADELKLDRHQEVERLIIHGILHLVGFDDHSDEERQEMHNKEDFHLSQIKF